MWRLRHQLSRMEGTICRRCGVSYFPPRELCRACCSREMATCQFSGRGTLYSFCGSSEYSEHRGSRLQNVFGLIQLEEGGLVFAQLTDVVPGQLRIGMPVRMVIRKLRSKEKDGSVVYVYKFHVDDDNAATETWWGGLSTSLLPSGAITKPS